MTNDYYKIPLELRLLPQWTVWKYEDVGAKKPTKVPYNPVTGEHADVNNSKSWTDFETAIIYVDKYNGLGFVLTINDPYFVGDLDDTEGDQVALDRQIKIYREFDTYSEVSPSGKGLHIIGKGSIPQGRRRSHIEIYSSQRYITMTGNVYNDKPIVERQSMLTQLWEQMGSGAPATYLYKGDDHEKYTDEQVIEQASNATNGEKFKCLHRGEWQDLYHTQSEADFAYIDIIAFYTQNRNQLSRIFLSSTLGKRDKAKRKDYLTWMINKSFDRMLPPLDFDGFKIALDKEINKKKLNGHDVATAVVPMHPGANPGTASTIILPPGLLGEIAQFIYTAAPRPVPEIALAAAIGLMAGITGRAYNISGTGLNQYVLLLAATGSGKEAMALGIDRLMNSVRMSVPTSTRFIGPSEIASGQALIKHLSKTSQCFVSILGEFGLRLESMSSPLANSAERTLKRMLLDLYNKSGHGQIFRPSIFADEDKNIAATQSPSFTILGESTPERFYSILNEDMISEGLLPRFMIIEYNGPRPKLNDDHLLADPRFLVDRFGSLIAYCESIMYRKMIVNIQCDEEATKLLKGFDTYADEQINGTNKEVLRQLWNRAHIKALKIAGLIAVGCNMISPVVTPDNVDWAIKAVVHDIRALSAKFEAGEIGRNTYEIKQEKELIRVINDYLTKDWDHAKIYSPSERMHYDKVIPYVYLNKRLVAVSAFKNDKIGATNSIKRAIQSLLDTEKLKELNKQDCVKKFNLSQRAFIVSDPQILIF